jgi:sporulation-control protein
MKHLLSSIGIGNADVDTILSKASFRRGEEVEAEVHVEGGETAQAIDGIEFGLATRYERDEGGYSYHVLTRFEMSGFDLEAGEQRIETVQFQIPEHTPLTVGRTRVWLETGLDIDWAVDPEDEDHLEIEPGARLEALFDALASMGFVFRDADCEWSGHKFTHELVQEFEFAASSGGYRGELDELEMICDRSGDDIEVFVEIDRRLDDILGEELNLDESNDFFRFDTTDSDEIRERLEAIVDRHL